MEICKVLDVPVSVTSYEEIIDIIKEKIVHKKKVAIVAINPKKVILFRESEYIKNVINSFDIFIPDGIAIVKSSPKIKSRITGIDLMEKICMKIGDNTKIFLYGSTRENVALTKQKLEMKFPKINIVGISDGYRDEVCREINESNADIVFIAKGSPLQEEWIFKHKNEVNASVLMGVGGAFDIYSGKIKRAPMIIRKCGFEWLYRVIKEPKRIKQLLFQIKYCHELFKERRKKI